MKKTIRLSTAKTRKLFKKGNEIYFYKPDSIDNYFTIETAIISLANKTSVKAIDHAKSGWETTSVYRVKYEDILIVTTEEDTFIIK